jgi:bifunctional lysine-specific demethylase and histidyl-hydroxylase NO66
VTVDITARTADAEGGATVSSLSRLCSAPPDVFATQVWSRRPWLSHSDELPGAVDDVFSAHAVDELLSRRALRTPFVRLAKDGRIVPPARYTGSGGIGATIADQVVDDAVLRLFTDGTTVVLQGVHRTWAPVGALAADLAAELGHPVQVNAYITPPQSQGFAPHYDTHDVFVLQVAGHKQWRVHEPVRRAPLPDEPWDQVAEAVRARAEEPPVLDSVLEPGDCLYLPRGFLHSATALGGTSIHLTFGIHAATERDVVRAVLAAVEAGDWRDSLPVGWDPSAPSGGAAVRAALAQVAAALERLDLAGVQMALHDERSARQRPEPVAPLAQAAAAADLDGTTLVRLRRHLGARLEVGADTDGHVLVVPGRRLPVGLGERETVEVLLRGDPVCVGELPGPDLASCLQLVRPLVREGVLVVEPALDAAPNQAPDQAPDAASLHRE